MRKCTIVASFTALFFVGFAAAADPLDREERDRILEKAEQRLYAIYERGEYRAKRFRAQWLPDGSGYILTERVPGSEKPVRVRYDCASGERTVPDPKEKEEKERRGTRSPDGLFTLYSDRGVLIVEDLKSGWKNRLTENLALGPVSCGRAQWSPDGKRIAYVKTNSDSVPQRISLVPGDPTYPETRKTRFARVGGSIPMCFVGVVDAKGGETRWLHLSKIAEQGYLGQVEWAGNSHELLVEKLSRFRRVREFFLIDVRTDEATCIFEEYDRAWVVASYRKNAGLQWIRGGNAFVVLSERDGWRHAYVCSRDGKEQTLLTPGEFDIIEKVAIDETRGWFYFHASTDNATQKYLYRVRLDGKGKPERVTPADRPGTHHYDIAPGAGWAFHTCSTFDSPPVTELVQLPGHRVVRVLEDNAELRRKMAPLISQPTEFLQLDIGDDVVMDAWIMKPSDFDPSKKYPLLVYVYGEPHLQTVCDAWGYAQADYHRLVANIGYLVVSIDNRGTRAPKGAAWRRAVFGSLGPLSTEEQAAGLTELARTRSYVDLTRVGIWGWSGGGSNTLNAMFRKPDVYHVGIAVAPKPQPHLYNAWFQEIYMETPALNPEGYRRSAPINFAEGLKGDLLIIHGTGETNTHIQITEGLIDRLIELGKRFDYMAYPNRDHGIRAGRGTTVHLRLLMVRYLLDHLEPGPK